MVIILLLVIIAILLFGAGAITGAMAALGRVAAMILGLAVVLALLSDIPGWGWWLLGGTVFAVVVGVGIWLAVWVSNDPATKNTPPRYPDVHR